MLRAMRLLTVVLVGFLAPACDGGGGRGGEQDPSDALEDVRDTLAEDSAVAGTIREPPGPPGDDEAAADTGPGAVIAGDEAPWTADPGAPGGAEPSSALPDWTTGEVAWQPEELPGSPVVAGLREARHEGFDRWVVEIRGGALPGYRVRYVDRPLHECGSGHEIHPVGDAWLELHLEPAQGHTDAGEATLPREVETPALTEGLRVYRTCDFEANVTLVMAVRSPEPFRAFHLREPARVVVDVRH